jgi:ubiquinone/menaquinone biosynthesis C-methylase UbiE
LKTLEKKVENFYSTGQDIGFFKSHSKKKRTEEFLSFGYWEKTTKTYLEAANNLLDFFISHSGIVKTDRILNVACGYGTETFAYYDAFTPQAIEAVDVTEKHVRYANKKAETLHLAHKIKFSHGDACQINFPDAAFTSIFAIEGPVHFNTRERFFKCASRLLRQKGDLLMTDIILGKPYKQLSWFERKIVAFTAKWWVAPKENWVDQDVYRRHLKNAGFEVLFLQSIGNKVFPGYAKNGFSLRTIWIRLKQRGPWATIGLTIISYLLGFLHKKGLIDYIYLRSRKEPALPLPALENIAL